MHEPGNAMIRAELPVALNNGLELGVGGGHPNPAKVLTFGSFPLAPPSSLFAVTLVLKKESWA